MSVSGYTEEQYSSAQAIVDKRYGEHIELLLADSDGPIDVDSGEASSCPALFWTARECNFIVLRTDEEVFLARYFYNPNEQFSTLQEHFNTIEDCVLGVLQAQSDHERELSEESDEAETAIKVSTHPSGQQSDDGTGK
jgi:hypothetical protein